MFTSITEVARHDPMVRHGLDSGASLEDIITAMAIRHAEAVKQIESLTAIAPKRYKDLSGKEIVWRCPGELIPLQEPFMEV